MLCWHKYKTGDIRKYTVNGVLMQMPSPVYFCLTYDTEKFISYCNGVGSRVGWFNKLIYHIIPDSIGVLNITGCSDLHDVGFAIPREFKSLEAAYRYFCKVNLQFRSNLRLRITYGTHLRLIRKARILIAKGYYKAVQSSTGWKSFMDGKIIDGFPPTDKEIEDFYNLKNP
jgi:hypothetical protein